MRGPARGCDSREQVEASAVTRTVRPNHAAWLGRGAWLQEIAVAYRRALPGGTGSVVIPVCLAGLAVLGLALAHGVGMLVTPVVLLLVAAALSEAFPVPIEGVAAGATSFANVFIVAAAVLYGWRSAAVVGALTMLFVEVYRRQRPIRLIFNSSLYVLGGAAAGLVAQPIPERFQTGLAGALAFYLVDVALLSAALARARSKPYLAIARSFYASTLAPFVVMGATAAILVDLWRNSPYQVFLLAPPLVAIVAYQRSLIAAMTRQRELDELKNEFIAVISHELRTPVSSVYGCAVTLEERSVDDELRGRLIGIIRRESARLAKLVEDVLWASRLDAKKTNRSVEPCDSDGIVREIAATAAEIAPENISVVVTTDAALPPVTADPEELRRVLANLVDNAVKYSPEGGTVEVAAHAVSGYVRFSVEDEGIGISEQERERIFERFVRLDPQMRRGIPGTGLGLYICKELAEQMGGRISVSGNNGRGSIFTFEIPATTEGELE
jgi:signal transduction histidine kinase